MPRALIIKGPLDDLEDLLRISRKEGKRALNCKRVRVDPQVLIWQDQFIVFVEEEIECQPK